MNTMSYYVIDITTAKISKALDDVEQVTTVLTAVDRAADA